MNVNTWELHHMSLPLYLSTKTEASLGKVGRVLVGCCGRPISTDYARKQTKTARLEATCFLVLSGEIKLPKIFFLFFVGIAHTVLTFPLWQVIFC